MTKTDDLITSDFHIGVFPQRPEVAQDDLADPIHNPENSDDAVPNLDPEATADDGKKAKR